MRHGAAAVLLACLFLVTPGRAQPTGGSPQISDPPLLEDFKLLGHNVDSWVLDRVFTFGVAELLAAPDPRIRFMGSFRQQLKSYKTPEELQTFMELAAQYMTWSANADEAAEALGSMPGGQIVLTNRGNETMVELFQRESQKRMMQIDSYTLLKNFQHDRPAGSVKPEDLQEAAPVKPVGEREAIRRLLRGWELNGVRYFLSHAGSPAISQHVWSYFGGQFRPTYRNSLNAILDPVQRRFQTVSVFDPGTEGVGLKPRPTEYPDSETNSIIAMIEFTGALPPAKLFSDWQTGIDAAELEQTLYLPGFNPHAAVLFTATELPRPEQPAKTINLPPVEVQSPDPLTRRVTVPPLTHNTVLLINSLRDQEWVTTLNGQPATLLLANGVAAAVLLPASETERTVELKRVPPKRTAFAMIAVAIGVLCVFAIIIVRRRNDAALQAELDGKTS